MASTKSAGKSAKELNTKAFLAEANSFIDLANRRNATTNATDLHMAFLYASARYSAYVSKAILDVDNHEDFVQHMVKQYTEMLRLHLADDALSQPAK